MSKGFKIILVVLCIVGLFLFHYFVSTNCNPKYLYLNVDTCQKRFMCKAKVIKTEDEAAKEMREANIFGIDGSRATIKCIPIYLF